MAAGTRTGTGDAATLASREMIARRLGKLGYDVTTRDDGMEALVLLAGRRFDLVLLDMGMSRLSGLRTLREMRASPRHADVPVMMMTARMDPAAAIEALEAGADDHVAKPFDYPVLAARIKRLLRRAAMIGSLRQANVSLDSSTAERAAEVGTLRSQLAAAQAERARMAEVLTQLQRDIARVSA